MKYALIDVGSNTIRLVIYEVSKAKRDIILNQADFSGLISYVKDGKLSVEGFDHLCNVLSNMKAIAVENGCDEDKIIAFATASLRGVANGDELCERVLEKTTVNMRIISGATEARYDYEGLRAEYSFSNGIAFDLGGGSCQLLVVGDDKIIRAASMQIGSQKLYDTLVFSDGILPNQAERNVISTMSKAAIKGNFGDLTFNPPKYVYAMGGAAKEITGILKKIYNKKSPIVGMEDLDFILSLSPELISKLTPNRAKTIVPAILTIKQILAFAKCSQIFVTTVGVREGVLDELLANKHCE